MKKIFDQSYLNTMVTSYVTSLNANSIMLKLGILFSLIYGIGLIDWFFLSMIFMFIVIISTFLNLDIKRCAKEYRKNFYLWSGSLNEEEK
jgi:hypothetical protein